MNTIATLTGEKADTAACSIEMILDSAGKSIKAAKLLASAIPLAGDEVDQLESIGKQISDLESQFARLWMEGFPR